MTGSRTAITHALTHQNWHITKVEPPIPIKNLITARPVAVFVNPIIPVGMALLKRIMPMGMRGPHLSQKGPRIKRIKIVPDTAAIEDVQISSVVKSNVI